MKVITIRNVPDDLYRVISRLAKRNRRSIQQQILTILERSWIFDNDSPVDKAREIRKPLTNRDLGDSIREIRQERNR